MDARTTVQQKMRPSNASLKKNKTNLTEAHLMEDS